MKRLCPLCNEDANLKYKLSSDVYFCRECSLYFAPDVSFNYNFVSELDEDIRQDALKAMRFDNFKTIVKHIKKNFSSAKRGLEIGSSYGWFLEVAKNSSLECIGMEPEKNLFDISKASGFDVIEGFFPQDLPQNFPKVDFIIFNDVLEHIPDLNSVMDKCHQLLNPNGVLIVNLPLSSGVLYNMSNIVYRLGIKSVLNRLWQFNFHSPHYHYFNKRSINKLVMKFGFSIADYQKLKVIDARSLDSRLKMDKKNNVMLPITKVALRRIIPFLKWLPEDIGCFYVQKQK